MASKITRREEVTISGFKALDLLRSQRGRFVTVTFVKTNNVFRTMNGRLGVTKGLNGGHNKWAGRPDLPYITFYEQGVGYRTLNLATLVEIKAQGKTFSIV